MKVFLVCLFTAFFIESSLDASKLGDKFKDATDKEKDIGQVSKKINETIVDDTAIAVYRFKKADEQVASASKYKALVSIKTRSVK